MQTMQYKILFNLMVLCLGLSACTTQPSKKQNLSIQTIGEDSQLVTGAYCKLANRQSTWQVTTPCTIAIHQSNDDLMVLCAKPGHAPGIARVVSSTHYPAVIQVKLGKSTTIKHRTKR